MNEHAQSHFLVIKDDGMYSFSRNLSIPLYRLSGFIHTWKNTVLKELLQCKYQLKLMFVSSFNLGHLPPCQVGSGQHSIHTVCQIHMYDLAPVQIRAAEYSFPTSNIKLANALEMTGDRWFSMCMTHPILPLTSFNISIYQWLWGFFFFLLAAQAKWQIQMWLVILGLLIYKFKGVLKFKECPLSPSSPCQGNFLQKKQAVNIVNVLRRQCYTSMLLKQDMT